MSRNIESFIEFCQNVVNGQGRGNHFDQAYLVSIAEKVIEDYDNTTRANHQGHVKQSFFVVYDFFEKYSVYKDPNQFLGVPFNIKLRFSVYFVQDMKTFLADTSNNCVEYDVGNFKQNIPANLGGSATDGGRWSPQYKRVIPLVKEYLY